MKDLEQENVLNDSFTKHNLFVQMLSADNQECYFKDSGLELNPVYRKGKKDYTKISQSNSCLYKGPL